MQKWAIAIPLHLLMQCLTIAIAFSEPAKTVLSTTDGLAQIKELIDAPGNPHQSQEKLREISLTLSEIIKKDPQSGEAYYLRAVTYDGLNEPDQALKDLNECLKLNHKNARAYWRRGILLFGSGKMQEALTDFNAAIANGEKSGMLYANRGAVYQQLRNHKLAIQDFDTSIDLAPNLWTTRVMRVGSNTILGNYPQIDVDCDAILQIKGVPPDIAAMICKNRGGALVHMGKYEAAIESFSKAASLMVGEEKGKCIYLRARCYGELGQKEKAEADLELAQQPGFEKKLPQSNAGPPPDRVVAVRDKDIGTIVKELTEKSRQSLPGVKARYLKGLPSGQFLYVMSPISNGSGVPEYIFVKVTSWNDDKIIGTISNEVKTQGYKDGDKIKLLEKDVKDWTIVHPDGSEEGNLIGKYMDTLR